MRRERKEERLVVGARAGCEPEAEKSYQEGNEMGVGEEPQKPSAKAHQGKGCDHLGEIFSGT